MTNPPTAFISYAWSTPEYADRVVELAEGLTSAGIHVVLDRWDLKEGQDKHEFMERAVKDPDVTRVLILCDPTYAAKADLREGGVGTETLIISADVYQAVRQEKFIPVIMERDDSGNVVVPTYLKGRIYIDLSDPAHDEREFERLVRNIFGQPELKRPPLGRPLAYLDDASKQMITGRSLMSFRDAVLRDRPHQIGLLDDYLERLLEAYRAELVEGLETLEELDPAIELSIEAFLRYRNEFIELIWFICRDERAAQFYEQLHGFFEGAVAFWRGRPIRWADYSEYDNLKFLSWELFLHAVGVAIRSQRFEAIEPLLEPYHITRLSGGDPLLGFPVVNSPCRLLNDVTQKRLGTRFHIFESHLLRRRTEGSSVPFAALMEADFLLWFRGAIDPSVYGWYPRTAAYAETVRELELFNRARSRRFFKKLIPALGVDSKTKLVEAFGSIPSDQFFQVVSWGGRRDYTELFQLDQLDTR